MGLFGQSKPPDPREAVREWSSKLRKETRQLERQIQKIEREEAKCQASIKQAAKKGERETCMILAKELIHSKRAKSRIHTSIAQINSVSLNMKNQIATARLSGAMKQSTDVMRSMQHLVRVPEIAQTMREMSKEMMKMGIIEEMVEDALEPLDQDELEEEAEGEVEKILYEITAGAIGEAPSVPAASLPSEPMAAAASTSRPAPARVAVAEEDEDMLARLEALRS